MGNGSVKNTQTWMDDSQIKLLMAELEMVISQGNHQKAASLAKELAIKRANCSLLTSKTKEAAPTSPIV